MRRFGVRRKARFNLINIDFRLEDKKEVEDLFTEIFEILEDLERVMVGGYSFTSTKNLLREARGCLAKDDFKECLDLVKKAKEEVEKEKRIVSQVVNLSKDIEVDEALKKIYEDIMRNINAGDLVTIEKLLNKLKDIIDRKSASPYDDIVSYLSCPLSNLISGYGCESSRVVELSGIKYKCCKLGAGGWGVVYLCERGNERIVVKMPFYAEAMFLGYERLTEYKISTEQSHEVEFLKSLNHPNILKLIEVRGPFLFYEYADHGSLAWQLANGYKPSLDDIFLLTLQISDALRYVHSRGILHGDVKPSNILLVKGIAKLGDFSSAKLVAKDKSLSIPSTYGYRAPEQVDMKLKRSVKKLGLENKVDIYQLGSTLLHVAMGEPLDGEEASEEEVGRRMGRVGDEGLAAMLREMLSIDPARRPSAEEIVKKTYVLLKKTA